MSPPRPWQDNPAPTAADIREKLHSLLHARTAEAVNVDGSTTLTDDPYSYFGFIPPFLGAAIPNGAALSFETDCWGSNSVTAKTLSNGSVALTYTTGHQKSFLCSDHVMFGTAASVRLGVEIASEGDHQVRRSGRLPPATASALACLSHCGSSRAVLQFIWDVPTTTTKAEAYDLAHKGIRVFQFTNSTLESIVQIVDTALL